MGIDIPDPGAGHVMQIDDAQHLLMKGDMRLGEAGEQAKSLHPLRDHPTGQFAGYEIVPENLAAAE